MSVRLTAALAACCLAVGAFAADKKKLDFSPETGPEPRVVEPGGAILPSPHYLEGQPPKYLLELPPLPASKPHSQPKEFADLPKPPGPIAGRLTLKTYAVGDLIIPMPAAGAGVDRSAKTLEADLIKKLTATVSPTSWVMAGGSATIEYFPLGMALVVNATPEVQAAVEKYLDNLRQVQDTQFEIKLVVVTVTTAGLEKLGFARDFVADKTGRARSRMKFLSADELSSLTGLREHCVDMTAPTVTALNGQEARATVGQVQHFLTGVDVRIVENGGTVFVPKNEPYHIGVEVRTTPSLSADGRFVKLALHALARDVTRRPVEMIPLTTKLKPEFENGERGPETPFTQFLQDPRIVTRSVDETVTMPDGGTVVFYGGPAKIEETTKEPLPLFADVPFLNEMMVREKKVTEINHLLVFATPRAIRPDSDECVQCAGGTGKLPKLMLEYQRACREGNAEEARRLALECIVLDPTCFSKK